MVYKWSQLSSIPRISSHNQLWQMNTFHYNTRSNNMRNFTTRSKISTFLRNSFDFKTIELEQPPNGWANTVHCTRHEYPPPPTVASTVGYVNVTATTSRGPSTGNVQQTNWHVSVTLTLARRTSVILLIITTATIVSALPGTEENTNQLPATIEPPVCYISLRDVPVSHPKSYRLNYAQV